jgi:signal transduction histidine kinase
VLLEGFDGELTQAQHEHVRIVSEASYHLLAIINDLLDMSTIEAGAVVLEAKQFPISRPLERIVRRFSLHAKQKNLELRSAGPESEILLVGDERRIEQVVANLVSNAIKYTVSGSVTLAWLRENDRLRIDVRDTGPGISDEDRGRLFKRFAQLAPARGRVTEGTGLGLAIAAGLVGAMGGEITLQSQLDAGSTFSVLLPIRAEPGGD